MLSSSDKQTISEILYKQPPVLFLGAGFSYGSKTADGEEIPGADRLKEMLFEHFIEGKIGSDTIDVKSKKLREICSNIVKDKRLASREEMDDFLRTALDATKPAAFHYYLSSYPWAKIYTVNVDRLAERVYQKTGQHFFRQVGKKKQIRRDEDAIELVKLHGSVDVPDEPMVFSEEDYRELTNGALNYRLNDLLVDLEKRNFIFVGAALDEPDIKYYLSRYENAGYTLGLGKLVFINLHPDYDTRITIENLGGVLIDASAEDFFTYVESLHYNPTEVEKAEYRLSYSGISSFHKLMDSLPGDRYESRLYQGFESKWEDLRDGWIFQGAAFQKACDALSGADSKDFQNFCLAIHGRRFSGKRCLLMLLAQYLQQKLGYDVLIYHGTELSIDSLKDYIEASPNKKFALLINNAAFLYSSVETLLQEDWGGKRLFIITTSREYYHQKKKYYLDGNPYEDLVCEDRISKADAESIYPTLKAKGMLGAFSRDDGEGVRQILSKNTFINLFLELTFGEGFEKRIVGDIKAISKNAGLFDLYLKLALFDLADLEYFPRELLNSGLKLESAFPDKKSSGKKDRTGQYVVDYISLSDKGISLKNELLCRHILEKAGPDEKTECLRSILVNLSRFVQEDRNDYWKVIYESLTKEDWLHDSLHMSYGRIVDFYYRLKDEFSEISYFWMQMGIAEQKNDDYASAENHLQMAATIHPQAYQIKHAIARNEMLYAIHSSNPARAQEMFEKGSGKMRALIDSDRRDYHKARNFSIHCYLNETIDFMKAFAIPLNRTKTREMHDLLRNVGDMDDSYYRSLVPKMAKFFKDNDALKYITLRPEDPLLQYVGEESASGQQSVLEDAFQ